MQKSLMPSKLIFSRSFGVCFLRAAQVQLCPPKCVCNKRYISNLVWMVEELQERASWLQTEVLEYKLVKEWASIVPVLKKKIGEERIRSLEAKNEGLKEEIKVLRHSIVELEERTKMDDGKEVERMRRRAEEWEKEASELWRENAELRRPSAAGHHCSSSSSSQKLLQGLTDASSRSSLVKSIKKTVSAADAKCCR